MENGNLFESSSPIPFRPAEASASAVREIIRNLDADAMETADVPVYTRARIAIAARFICSAVRDDGLPIEQALIRVKDAWRSTPGRPKPRPGGNDPVLDQLVSACIREFYTER
jgi:hypothetical protein